MNIVRKTQRKYKISLIIETVLFISIFFLVYIQNVEMARSFLVGAMSAFFPFLFFVALFFFVKNPQKMNIKRLYIGEALKLLLTVAFIILFFELFKINFIVFFVGYFISILLNNLLPFIVEKSYSHF
ncbi:hypothetical protein A6A19_05715 [Actinobacillus delphinicola]|uniref:F0F1 ATP synthase subunit I n=1 Tax=Actinobacillus delphinicola TaxID=51161 RepID=A0A448TU12_9PAST|nr:hypothetical protein [Actinobacillus delphinicola]VEJ09288.1 F0F1 ATP synthase subunit I [Actinobacillus delphinicola]